MLVSMYILHLTAILVTSESMAASKWPPMPSGFKFDLRLQISNLNYSGIHVHNASIEQPFGGL